MKTLLVIIAVISLFTATICTAFADNNPDPMGPAPNSGDGIPDGSGFEAPNGPNSAIGSESGPMGPAPNSGDGIPDGSGFDAPNGPNGDIELGSGPMGPAPNSGDGISDGSGF